MPLTGGYDTWVIPAILVLAVCIWRQGHSLGKQLEGVHDSLRRILAQPLYVRRAELEKVPAAKKKHRSEGTVTP